ncbi:hypothetical protein Acr_18g0008690 [Actinidia rufa]|uniref:Uncharacterized protein n=1 Tax=Actinidia rufa TaxID=165716 RepID=A0A7J0G7F0_9ERIC|nr:hypothetical protein Acr_18g0008690 [Actinidia rufa]
MHLRSRLLPKQSTNNPLDNRAQPMANTCQALNLDGIHREMYGIAEQIRIMNEINVPLVTKIRRIAKVLVSKFALQNEERVLVCRSLGHLDELRIWQTEPPFTERVMKAKVLSRFKLPSHLGVYEGKTDPMDHLDSYKKLDDAPGVFKRGPFNQVVLEVEDPNDKVVIMAMMEVLHPSLLIDSLSKSILKSLLALQIKVDKYITAEKLAKAKCIRRGKDDHKRKEPDTRRTDYKGQPHVRSKLSMEGLDYEDVQPHPGKGILERQMGEYKKRFTTSSCLYLKLSSPSPLPMRI